MLAQKNLPEFRALTSIFLVEPPGIELGAEGPVTCGKTEFDNAKRRDNVKRLADTPKGVDDVNTSCGALWVDVDRYRRCH